MLFEVGPVRAFNGHDLPTCLPIGDEGLPRILHWWIVVDRGRVTVTLPTQAGMAYAGEGKNLYYPPDTKITVVARWTLPRMAKGETWKARVTVGTVEGGYYHVGVQTETRGPLESPYVIDSGYRKAWMFITEGGGELTGFFDESIFPDRISPVPGPFKARPHLRGSAHAMQAAASQTGAAASSS